MSTRIGICTVCQGKVLLEKSSEPRSQLLEEWGDDSLGLANNQIDREYGDSINYLCIPHDFYGEHCEGSGQIPQVVLK